MRAIGSKLRRRSNVSSLFEQLESRRFLNGTLMVGPSATYHTIQAAVNAATPNTTIQVAPGMYVEQVTIPAALTGLTIQAMQNQDGPHNPPPNSSVATVNAMNPNKDNSSYIVAPAVMTGNMAIVDDLASGFQLKGFVVEGPSQGIGFGVLIEGGATSVQIIQNHILHIHDVPASGNQTGRAVVVTGGSSAMINQNFISDYQKSGIEITGAGSVGAMMNNLVVGFGPTNLFIDQNGIEVVFGASGTVSNNIITGNIDLTGTSEDGGILLFNSGQTIVNNNISYNNNGDIILDGPSNSAATSLTDYPHGTMVMNNETYGATLDGIDLFDGANSVTISNNNSHNNAVDGLFIDPTSEGNLVVGNHFLQNFQSGTGFDIEDATVTNGSNAVMGPLGTGNLYSNNNNQFGTANFGVIILGTDLHFIDSSSNNDHVQIHPAGSSNTGSTGVQIQAMLSGVNFQYTYAQSFPNIFVLLGGGNDQVTFDNNLTMNAMVSAGNGNDNIQTGLSNTTVMLGDGTDQVHLGNGNNVVTLGNGQDTVQAGNGMNTVMAGDGQDHVTLGNGSFNSVTLGNGMQDNVQMGNGSNNTVTVGNGQGAQVHLGDGSNDNVTVGNGQGDQVQIGKGNFEVVVVGNGDDNVTLNDGSNDTVTLGTGKDNVHIGNGNNNTVKWPLLGNPQTQIQFGSGVNNVIIRF